MLWREMRRNPLLMTQNTNAEQQALVNALNTLLLKYRRVTLDTTLVRTMKAFTNNSVVGLSKVLFAFDPRYFPIWDSRVARTFNETEKKLFVGSDIAGFIRWVDAARKLTQRKSVQRRISVIRRKYARFRSVPDLRIVEFVVFWGKAG